jgi:hypothetical protein
VDLIALQSYPQYRAIASVPPQISPNVELSELSKQHEEALASAAFIGSSQLDSRKYHERRSRIGKLSNY